MPYWASAQAKLRLATLAGRWLLHRQARVLLLLVAVLAMSFADLAMTVTYATSVGMVELNPLARAMMSGGVYELVAWKMATVLLGVGILYFIRRTRGGEFGAWVCCLLLAALTCHWIRYNHEASAFTRELHIISQGEDTGFVQMTPQ